MASKDIKRKIKPGKTTMDKILPIDCFYVLSGEDSIAVFEK
jgi:hypothetical protein